jgi:hypothetical protein
MLIALVQQLALQVLVQQLALQVLVQVLLDVVQK